jgi:hypothetical protein
MAYFKVAFQHVLIGNEEEKKKPHSRRWFDWLVCDKNFNQVECLIQLI